MVFAMRYYAILFSDTMQFIFEFLHKETAFFVTLMHLVQGILTEMKRKHQNVENDFETFVETINIKN